MCCPVSTTGLQKSSAASPCCAVWRGWASKPFAPRPTRKLGSFCPPLEDCRDAHAELLRQVQERSLPVAIPLAAENMWDATLYERIEADTIPSYDGGPAFLVEFSPGQLPVGLFERLFSLRCRGKLPVIAHPERYQPLWKNSDLVDKLRSDCALVVDLGAVAGHHGRKQAKMARKLLMEGHAHAAASDAHTVDDVQVAAQGIAWIQKKLGGDAVQRLLDVNPRRILAGEHPDG